MIEPGYFARTSQGCRRVDLLILSQAGVTPFWIRRKQKGVAHFLEENQFREESACLLQQDVSESSNAHLEAHARPPLPPRAILEDRLFGVVLKGGHKGAPYFDTHTQIFGILFRAIAWRDRQKLCDRQHALSLVAPCRDAAAIRCFDVPGTMIGKCSDQSILCCTELICAVASMSV